MTDKSDLLRAAIEGNVAWCSRVCAAHGSKEALSSIAWTNSAAPPLFYPNIITRERGVLNEIVALAEIKSKGVSSETAILTQWPNGLRCRSAKAIMGIEMQSAQAQTRRDVSPNIDPFLPPSK